MRMWVAGLEASETQHKRAEEKLRTTQGYLDTFLLDLPVGIAILEGPDFRYYRINHRLAEINGLPVEDHLDRPLAEVLPEAAADIIPGLRHVLETGEPLLNREFSTRLPKDPDVIRYFIDSFFPIKGADGKPWAVGAVVLEITEHKQTEEKLRFKQSAVDHNADPTYWISADSKICYVNDAGCRILGYSQEELRSMTIPEIDPDFPPEAWPEHWQKMKDAGSMTFESHHKTKSGQVFPVETHTSFIQYQNEEYIWAYVHDITVHKQVAKDLSEKVKDLEILNTITQAVHQSLELEDVYKIALDMTTDLENVDMVMIYLVDDDRKEAVLQAQRKLTEDYIHRAGTIPYPKGITWKTINTGEIVNIEDIQKDPNIGPAGRDLGHHGVLGIPITLEEKVIGVIFFLSYKERVFDKQEVRLLSSIGDQIAVAITKAKLYKELSKKNRYESIISAVTRSVHQSINLQEVLENAVEAMNENIDVASNVSIFMAEGKEAVLKSYRGFPDWFMKRLKKIPYPKGFTWKTIIEGKLRYCADVDKDTIIGPAGRQLGTKSYVSIPISYEGKTVGCINVHSFQKNSFGEEEINLLETISHQIGVAIKNANQAEALRESEQRYRTLFDQSPVGVCIIDKNLKITHCNEKMVQIFQSSYKKIIGLDLAKLKDRSFVPAVENAFEGHISDHETLYEATTSGAKLWLHARVVPLRSSDGNVFGVMGVVEDITERKRSEQELKNAFSEIEKLKDCFQEENIYLRKEIMQNHNLDEIIGKTDAIKKVLLTAVQVADTDTTVLILGETGTGKELFAHAIHKVSKRSGRPMVKVNCATLPATLIESELFGHEKGAFTGATMARKGRFELANGGTIFLDEIAELPLDLQAKLLQVLQENKFQRLGSSLTIHVDVRIIAATNRDLEEEVRKGRFRGDLYYRLNVFPILIPPLCERKEDITLLVESFIDSIGKRLGKKIETIPRESFELLKEYHWPGNIRELKNIIERAVIITQGSKLQLPESLKILRTQEEPAEGLKSPQDMGLNVLREGTLEEIERDYIVQVMEKTYWRIEGPYGAAEILGLNPSTLRSRTRKLGIKRPRVHN